MTVREVVEQVMKDLGDIKVPIAHLQDIAIPITHGIQGLAAVLRAWDEEDKQNQKQPEEPEMKLEVVPAEEVPEEVRNNG